MFRRLHRDYFSLTRGERRGMQILSIGVIILVIFRALIPLLHPSLEEDLSVAEKEFIAFQDSIMELRFSNSPGSSILAGTSVYNENLKHGGISPRTGTSIPAENLSLPEPFPFDPNKASITELTRLGIPIRTVRTLINYREAGGEFKRDSDLLRVYGLTPEIYKHLKEYILIDSSVFETRIAFSVDTSGRLRVFDLNRADSLQLLSVYGIGPVFAHRLITYRKLLGGFYSPEQLMEVYGFSPTQYQEIMQRSFLDTNGLRKLDLNRVDVVNLSRHPYLDRYQAESIIYYRELKGSFEYEGELLENKLLPDSVYLRIRPYLIAGPNPPGQ